MAGPQDYYETLGIDRSAADGEIKRAYRKLAMQYHPDRNKDDTDAERKFKEINEAYAVLSDPDKRSAYDRFGHAAFENGGAGPGGFDFAAGSFADVFDDLFGEFMGGGRRRRSAAARGADMRYNLEVTLEEAFRGTREQIRIPVAAACEDCGGSGAAPGSEPATCATCHGHGKVRAQQGFFTIERTCPACHGAGRVIQDPCTTCAGGGRVQREKTLAVNIPPGVEDGTRIRLAGEGEAGMRGGPPGDLYIFLSVAPHELFRREGANLFCRVPIAMVDAALGGAIEVPTLEGGRVTVNIPAGSQSGRHFRLRGKGMPQLRGRGQGDLYIETVVETPMNLTKRQKELLREFAEAGKSEETSPESHGFFAKVRELWDDLTE